MQPQSQSRTGRSFAYVSSPVPAGWVEYAFYCSLLNSMVGAGLGLEIPYVSGLFILLTAGVCIFQLRSRLKEIYAPIALMIACAISFVTVQVVVHDESLMSENIRIFIVGMLQLVILHALCLRRGFALRFPFLLFAFGVIVLPFMIFTPGEVVRGRVDSDVVQGTLTHSGGLAEWFGFCAVYFAVIGVETRRSIVRVSAWLLAVASLVIVTVTVARSPIFAAALAITIACRRLLRRGFVPVLMLIIIAGVIAESGIFDEAIFHYSERGMEETGRGQLWPAAIDRISSSPLFGVGYSNIGLYAISGKYSVPPHNSFLFFALASGALPFSLWVTFWIQMAWRSAVHKTGRESEPFRMPYLLFTFVTALLSDTGFLSYSALFSFSLAAGSAVIYGKQRFAGIRAGNKNQIGLVARARTSRF